MLLLHILIATSGLGVAAYTLVRPSKAKLNSVYALTALTFATGFYLVFTKQAQLTPTCQSGLIYLGVMVAGIFAIRYRLAKQAV